MLRILLIGSVVALSAAFSPALPSRVPALRNGACNRVLTVHRAVVKPEDVARLVDEGMREEDAVALLKECKDLKEVSTKKKPHAF
jgi:hypothetical protein